MPSGIPKSGKRKFNADRPVGRPRQQVKGEDLIPYKVSDKKPTKSDQEISKDIKERFDIMLKLIDTVAKGKCRSLIISGPAGCGKTFAVDERMIKHLNGMENYHPIKGYATRTGLYETFYNNRKKGQVVVFDDADSIFFDPVALNLLKAACDTTPVRTLSYLSKFDLTDSSGLSIPKSFTFNGSVIFITNLDFDAMIDKKTKLAPHLSALISRANYVDLAMKTRREYLVRIRQVCISGGMFKALNLTPAVQKDVLNYLHDNEDKLREISLRQVGKISEIRKAHPKDWVHLCNVTCLRV